MDNHEAELLRDTVRHWLAEASGGGVTDRLDAEGWCETVPDDLRLGWGILFEEWATALSPAPILDFFVVRTLGVEGAEVAVVYPAGVPTPAPAGPRTVGYVHGARAAATSFVWLHARGAAVCDPAEVDLRPAEGIDPEFALGVAELSSPPSDSDFDSDLVAETVSNARVLQGFALAALGRRMLQLALEHVTTREQFGRRLAAFQAVKHQLADCAVELEAARATIEFAAEGGDAVAALAARATAGRAAFAVGRTAQQMMGAMGFTWEVPLHRYVRRAHATDLLLGPWENVAFQIGERLLDEQRAPRLGAA